MHWVVATWLITSLLGLGMGHNTLFEGYDRTLSGYHLCNVTEHVSVTNVISYPTSYTQRRPCGGWLPWAMCDVMVYKTEYKTEVYSMPKQVMKCCHGYEQVGSYCALSLNRSAEFASKPGLCPSTSVTRSLWNNSNSSGFMCKWDIDCPQWQKCCQTDNISNIYQCSESDPVPPANRTCFNVTITVKTSFQRVNMDKGLFNHTRLLHSVVTGALATDEISVHHVQSWSAGPFTTSSSLLVCSSNVFFLEDISTRLDRLGNIEEVTSVVVQDVDECAVLELNSCSPHAYCMNTEGSYSCACHSGYHDLNPSQPGTDCMAPNVTMKPFMNNTTPSSTTHPPPGNSTITDREQMTIPSEPFWTSTVDNSSRSNNPSTSQPPSTCDYIPEITNLFSYDVNASAFRVAWTTHNQTGVTFHLVLLQETTVLENISHVENFNWMFNILNPAVIYTVRVTPFVCGNQGNSKEIKVTTGQLLLAAARLTNMNYTKALSDPNSDAYEEFCRSVINEILLYLPSETRALVNSREVIIQITSLSAGSVIVHFSIIFQPSTNLTMSSMFRYFTESLQSSSNYTVDSIYTEDLNECLAAETDCSPWASCENTNGSYTCACWSGYTDLSPSRPGRSCAASPNATTVNPTTNHPGVSSNSTATDTTTSITKTTFGNPSMSSTVSTTHVQTQSISKTTVSSTSTTNRLTTMPANITTTILKPMTSNITCPLISYVAVECSLGYISVFIKRDFFVSYSIPEITLYLGKPECAFNGRNESHVWVTTVWNKCGITLENNSTHNSFNVTLYNIVSEVSNVHLEVPIVCTYPSRIIVSTGYDPPGYFDMINDPVAGLGSFQVTVRLMNGTYPLPQNSALYPDDEVIVEVAINTNISQIKVVISKCWVTSSSNSSESPSQVFLLDGCAANSYTTVVQNGNGSVSLLSVQIFSFVNLDVIFLHCQIQICVEIQENTCRPDCMGRAYRASNLIGLTKASVGPLNRLHKASSQTETSDTVQTIGFALLGVGVFLCSLAAVAGLVYHKRKIGVYNFNFKPQQENFSYNVFST